LSWAFSLFYYSNDLKNLANIKNFGLAGMFLLTFLASSIFSLTPVAMPYWVLTFTLPGILAARYGIWAVVWVGG